MEILKSYELGDVLLVALDRNDRSRLITLIENAIAEVEAAVEPDAAILPDGIDSAMNLIESYDWGRFVLARLKAAQ